MDLVIFYDAIDVEGVEIGGVIALLNTIALTK